MVRDVAALGEDNIAQTWSSLNNSFHSSIGYSLTGSQVEDAQVLIRLARRKGQERAVVHELAIRQAELPQRLALDQERRDWCVADQSALLQINFQDVWTVLGEGENSLVGDLGTFIQFELEMVSIKVS